MNLSINIDKIVRMCIMESVDENGIVDRDEFNERVDKHIEPIYDEIEGRFEKFVEDMNLKVSYDMVRL